MVSSAGDPLGNADLRTTRGPVGGRNDPGGDGHETAAIPGGLGDRRNIQDLPVSCDDGVYSECAIDYDAHVWHCLRDKSGSVQCVLATVFSRLAVVVVVVAVMVVVGGGGGKGEKGIEICSGDTNRYLNKVGSGF